MFQYGSNTDPDRLNSAERLSEAAVPLSSAFTEESFELYFDLWSDGNGCAVADLIAGAGRRIFGVLYEVPANRIFRSQSIGQKTLDQIEGQRYQGIEIQVKRLDSGAVVPARTYIGRAECRQEGIQTSEAYIRHILTGLRRANAPSDYLDYAVDRIIANNPALSMVARELAAVDFTALGDGHSDPA